MLNETLNQGQLFLIYCLCGFLTGVIFDIFRVFRRSFKTPDFITNIEDIVFWFLTSIIIITATFNFNNGKLRSYIFIGIFIGLSLYFLVFSKSFIKISIQIIQFLKNIIYKLIKIITIPFKYLLILLRKLLIKPISFIFVNIRQNTFSKLKNIKKNIIIFNKKTSKKKDFEI